MVDFDLTPEQQAIRTSAKAFAAEHLTGARAIYEAAATSPEWENQFRSTLPLYRNAVQAGMIKAQVPASLGGLGGSLLDAALVVEEFYAVEASASLTIFGTGLGLTPLILAGSPEQQQKFLKPFLGSEGAPLASLVFSEPDGSANFVAAGAAGFGTTATLQGAEYILNGEKIWATNCSGWDDRGADVQCVVCRILDPDDKAGDVDKARRQTAILIVTREDIAANDPAAFQVLSHPPTVGHTSVNGPHVRFSNLRVPAGNLLAPAGKGAEVVEMTFTASAALVGAMGVGIMRQAFERALEWSKAEKRGSHEVMIQKQSVADLLIKIKVRCEAARALTWKAALALGKTPFGGELAYEAKIFGSEGAVDCVMDAINLIGVSAYHQGVGLGNLLNDAVVLPIFDGGNVGVRRRQIEKIFMNPQYKPWEATFGP
ncbi:hypothetical protein BP5796_11799 [Coleophoma crateriformis]|uniref:Acyl-CoA dehydrogenase n=1 Tax=Coleophoma crateriformis TaxID=565419 RepID=A0A3D8QEC7_9HELO|nr:hypothetical protein BP5796_11799 [Coleophoma crateriformis]